MCNDDNSFSVILRCKVRDRWLSITHQILFTLTLLQCCFEFLNKRVLFSLMLMFLWLLFLLLLLLLFFDDTVVALLEALKVSNGIWIEGGQGRGFTGFRDRQVKLPLGTL